MSCATSKTGTLILETRAVTLCNAHSFTPLQDLTPFFDQDLKRRNFSEASICNKKSCRRDYFLTNKIKPTDLFVSRFLFLKYVRLLVRLRACRAMALW